jgi:hypothetical protein
VYEVKCFSPRWTSLQPPAHDAYGSLGTTNDKIVFTGEIILPIRDLTTAFGKPYDGIFFVDDWCSNLQNYSYITDFLRNILTAGVEQAYRKG